MAETADDPRSPSLPPSVDPRSGFDGVTKTFCSLRPTAAMPSPSVPLSAAYYAESLLHSPLPSHPAILDATTGAAVSFPDLLSQIRSLAASLRAHLGLSNGHVAFILSPNRLEIPVLYLALFSIGAVAAPANPASTPSEIASLVRLSKPTVAFAVSSTAAALPRHLPTLLLDSLEFHSFLTSNAASAAVPAAEVRQPDVAAILFSSGTTGRVKAAALTHRSFIAMMAGFYAARREGRPEVKLLTAPMFHTMGFVVALKGVVLGATMVLMGGGRAGVAEMLRAAEQHRVTEITAAPPVVVAMGRPEVAAGLDLSALERVVCGGAPLHPAAAERFMARFPRVELSQGYGSTEAGGISILVGPDECCHVRSAGRLSSNVEAKIVDTVTGEALSVAQEGELWVRGPAIMKGYVGDDEANASIFSSDGWLKTGDLCYFDHDGFLYIVDRLKELIKYKAYQVPPAELELLLQSLPEIVEAAVVPYPHEEAGQIPMAFVVRQPGSNLSEAEIIDFVAKKVAPYKKIRKVAFVDSIPKSAAGKILRRELRKLALSTSKCKL
ncbi:4-coumarate--CoA ligase-like 7 [Phoenix dactylifera]|uniref:4-coumarate--CoA ligase n=1 Tax=Phoenix dactylifera TaxID=42345 RepID=A0A8B7CVL1_PHODC|nr:4-coumarate--CoA ligase-like 7 [Phoenix dactylifera]